MFSPAGRGLQGSSNLLFSWASHISHRAAVHFAKTSQPTHLGQTNKQPSGTKNIWDKQTNNPSRTNKDAQANKL